MMDRRISIKNFTLLYIIFALSVVHVESAPLKDYVSEIGKPLRGIAIRQFFGPWDVVIKRNGDYVDYGDYGVHIPDFPPNSPDFTYDGIPVSNGYLNELPPNYEDRLSQLNSEYLVNPIGLAVFRTGIRTGESNGYVREFEETGSRNEEDTTPLYEDELKQSGEASQFDDK